MKAKLIKFLEYMLQKHTMFMYLWPLFAVGSIPVGYYEFGLTCFHYEPPPNYFIVKRGWRYDYDSTNIFTMPGFCTFSTRHGAVAGAWRLHESLLEGASKWEKVP